MKSADMNETKEQESMAQEQGENLETMAQAEEPAMEERIPEETKNEQVPSAAEDPRVAELMRQAEETQSRLLRAQADFDNFRRRTQKEKEGLAQYASMKLVEQLLPVLDNFERAMQSAGEELANDSFFKGIDMIQRQLTQVLETEGLRKMDAAGTPFDPEMHQAVMRVESEEHEEGTVVEVLQSGYWLKDKVLRPAMVKVSG